MNNTLWAIFISCQLLSAGHINYQQESGYREINPIYGEHPSHMDVYKVKGIETLAIYGLTKLLPKYEKEILGMGILGNISFMVYDRSKGITLTFKW